MTLYDDSTVDDFPPELQVSEPKTPEQLVEQCWRGSPTLGHFDEEALIDAIAARDEQIREQERARVREVLVDRLRHNRPRGFDAAVSETLGIAMDLGIDLEGTDD